MSMSRSPGKSDPLLCLLFHRRHSTPKSDDDSRRSTIDCQGRGRMRILD
jgi:hypothetical protein